MTKRAKGLGKPGHRLGQHLTIRSKLHAFVDLPTKQGKNKPDAIRRVIWISSVHEIVPLGTGFLWVATRKARSVSLILESILIFCAVSSSSSCSASLSLESISI